MIYRRNPKTEKVFRAGLALARLLRLGVFAMSVVAAVLMCVSLFLNQKPGMLTEVAIGMIGIIALNGLVWALERLYRHGTQLK